MKKIYLALVCLIAGVSSMSAQGSVVFTNGDGGEVLADGATITANHVVEDELDGTLIIHSGLFVKNTGSAAQQLSVETVVESLPYGTVQICFPSTCNSLKTTGTYDTSKGTVGVGASKDLQTEWLLGDGSVAYNKAKVTYKIKLYTMSIVNGFPNYSFSGYGPSVTVVYDYADPAGIDGVEAEKEVLSVAYYSVLGQKMPVAKGLCIKKTTYADGTHKCVKVVVK